MKKQTLGTLASLLILTCQPATNATAAGMPSPLKIGDRVQTSESTPVWTTPPIGGTLSGTQLPKSMGSLTEGPVRSGDMWWLKVNFDTGVDGWAPERKIRTPDGNAPAPRLAATSPRPPQPISDSFVQVQPGSGTIVSTPKIALQGKLTHDVYAASLVGFKINGKNVSVDRNGDFTLPVTLTPGNNTFNIEAITPNPRQQMNQISAYIDVSVVYGTDSARAAALRTFQGGLLKTSGADLMPLNTAGFANANDAHFFPDNQMFLSGDVRANENVELSAIHILFLREHNQIANAISNANPKLNDEEIFQAARKIVVAEIQVITYKEFLPALLGNNAIRPYNGYKPDVNPGIATEFSTGAYRIGHTLINDDVELLDNDGNEIDEALALAEAFFNPSVLQAVGPAPLLKYLATDKAQEVDTQLVNGLRNFLFGPPGAGGFDLASLNIQRGRDHGLSDYNTTRAAYGLPRVSSFAQITLNPAVQAKLLALYGSVNAIDLWVGGLAEDHLAGSSVGPTFQRIIADQFERLRDGDRFWYSKVFSGPQLESIERTRLSDIIRRNTTLTKIQDNVFFFDDTTLAALQPKSSPLPAAFLKVPPASGTAPALDGKGNNLSHPTWGSAGVDLMRMAPAAYGDSVSTPAGSTRPSARLVSNSLCDLTTTDPNNRNLSDWIYGWGQFLDHDIGLTPSGDAALDIKVPTGDPYFDPKSTGSALIYFTRSLYDSATGTSSNNVQKRSVTITYKPQTPKPPVR